MQEIKKDNIFLRSALEEIPRLLGQLNRNKASRYRGSFDRQYWHYRTNDISCARKQEAVLTLALLYSNDFMGNSYFKDKDILENINAVINFSLSIQNRDGSFNEWYINEKSFVATAFWTVVLSETLLILGKEKLENYKKAIKSLEKSADWLSTKTETTVSNQLSGSVLALYNVYLLTEKETYKREAEKKLNIIISSQHREGWWEEYGGPDIGYLSLMVDYLSKYYIKSKNKNILPALQNSLKFLKNFLHPDFTVGGEYMSRNTEYLIPSGFTLLSSNKDAKEISKFIQTSLQKKTGISPSHLDDRYLCYILYNWIQSGLSLEKEEIMPLDELWNRKINTKFSGSGIFVLQNDDYYFVTNLYKGGSFRLYTKDGRKYFDSGVEVYGGVSKISGVLDPTNNINLEKIKVFGSMKLVKEPLMKTLPMLIFKGFFWLTGRVFLVHKFAKVYLRKKMITYKKNSKINFEREFEFKNDKLIVIDKLNQPVDKKHLGLGSKASYNFIPSSKYFAGSLFLKKSDPKIEINISDRKTKINREFKIR